MIIIQYRERANKRANKGAFNEHGGQKGGQKVSEKTIDTILRYIKDNPYITRKALGEKTGISTSAIQKHINRLKADGVIVRHGGDRGGYWIILK